jgi:hypothetical protein
MQSAYEIPGYAELIEAVASKVTGADMARWVLANVMQRESEGRPAADLIVEEMAKAFDAQLDEIRRLKAAAAHKG